LSRRSEMIRNWTRAAAVFLTIAATAAASLADTVTLKSGQVFEGRVVETQDKVTVFLPYGTIAFYKEEVTSITYGPTPAEAYKERASKVAADDAEGHYQLGLYCQEKKLVAEAQAEFEKAVAADPNHAGARAKLGYVRQGETWMKYEQYMASKGYVLYKGRYITGEQAQELEAKDKALAREREAANLVRTLVYLITYSSESKSKESQERLAGVSDPAALGTLIEQFENENPAVRNAALLAMLNYREDRAALAVLDEALYDPVTALRYQARAILNRKQNERAFLAALSALGIDDDTTRFRASEALGAIADPRAIPSLIEYISWRRPRAPARTEANDRSSVMHRDLAPTYVAGVRAKVAPGVVAYEPIMGTIYQGKRIIFDPDTGWGLEEPRAEPEWRDEVVLNYEGLAALKSMTGQDFRFDKASWRDWYLTNRWRFEKGAEQRPSAFDRTPAEQAFPSQR